MTTPRPIVVEASELGLPPGQWPKEILILGVFLPLVRLTRDGDGDVLVAIYSKKGHADVHVLND